ncbi:MAG TPA: GNAT family N-acetyltransferase [Patescibacteria group bacterium]|jgi:L-amino acid N-acyltransferase YncA|nr:GNAT family N-acetyltransferase [Patescibacteria group bacterium]
MADYRLRPATGQDAAAIALIYNQGIEDRLATLETELRTADERRQWLSARSPRHPIIVAETTEPETSSNRPPTPRAGLAGPATTERATTHPPAVSTILAWGSLNPFSTREAYRFVADFSVYVERGWRGKGVGRALLARLIELGREHGYHKLVLSAFPFNKAGVALYETLGFRTVGIYREQGLLDGQWVDTIIMEKLL